jgi:hypothetical protein
MGLFRSFKDHQPRTLDEVKLQEALNTANREISILRETAERQDRNAAYTEATYARVRENIAVIRRDITHLNKALARKNKTIKRQKDEIKLLREFPMQIGGITLGEQLSGKITEAEAVALVNSVLAGFNEIREGKTLAEFED